MFRVHQFNKVELFAYTLPEQSWEEFERILGLEEANVQELGLPYRVVNIAAGDLSSAAAKRYDIEAWFPSQERYRELTSASNTTDFQARRLGVRFRRDGSTRAGAHAERHGGHGPVGARDPGELPGRGPGRAPPVRRPTQSRAQLTQEHCSACAGLRWSSGGVPERSNGAVLKTVGLHGPVSSNLTPAAYAGKPQGTALLGI